MVSMNHKESNSKVSNVMCTAYWPCNLSPSPPPFLPPSLLLSSLLPQTVVELRQQVTQLQSVGESISSTKEKQLQAKVGSI